MDKEILGTLTTGALKENIQIAIDNVRIAISQISEYTTTYNYLREALDDLVAVQSVL